MLNAIPIKDFPQAAGPNIYVVIVADVTKATPLLYRQKHETTDEYSELCIYFPSIFLKRSAETANHLRMKASFCDAKDRPCGQRGSPYSGKQRRPLFTTTHHFSLTLSNIAS